MIFGLHIIDFLVLVGYLIGITIIGLWMARTVHNVTDYVMPRRFGRFMMVMFTFGAGTHSDQAVGVTSKTFTNGLSGIWYQWLWLFCSPFYWLIAPVMKRFRAITTADVYQARFNTSVAMLFTVVSVFMLMIDIGVMLKGSGAIVEACTGGRITSNMAVAVMSILFVVYGVAGGLSAAIVTDLVQGILTIIFSFMLLPFILYSVGGVSGMHATITDPHMFSLVAPSEIGVLYIVIIAFNALIGWVAQPHVIATCSSGKSEMDGRIGTMVGSLVKRFCTIAWTLTGIAAVAYFAGREVIPDQVFGLVAQEFLPAVAPGLLGLFLAALLASVMSSCDAVMIAAGGLFAENFYKHLVPNRSSKHYLWVVRAASAAVVAGALCFAYWLPGVVQGLEIIWMFPAMMGVAFWLGLYWRRTTSAGAWAATIVGFGTWYLSAQDYFVKWIDLLPVSKALRLTFVESGNMEMYLPWQMVFYLSTATLSCIIVSLLTKPVDEIQLENFYGLVRTPVVSEEILNAPCVLPEGQEPMPRHNIFPAIKSLEIPVPSKVAMIGFIVGWLIVAAIICLWFIPGFIR